MVVPHLGPGGAQRVAALIANEWAQRGWSVHLVLATDRPADVVALHPAIERSVLAPRGGRRVDLSRKGAAGAPAISLPAASGGSLENVVRSVKRLTEPLVRLMQMIRLRRLLKRTKPHAVFAFVAPVNVLTVLAGARLGRRIVISERNDPTRQSFGPAWDFLRKKLYAHATVVTANSRAALSSLAAFVPAARLAYLPNPLLTDPSGALSEVGRARRILAVGRLRRQKGHDVLLEAYAASHAVRDGWRLVIAGDGLERHRLRHLASSLAIEAHVEWLGHVADPAPLFSNAGIFVLPSRHEGTPNALLEAMAAGLPPIVTDASSGALDYVENGRTGLVVATEDAGRLADAIDRLIADSALRERLGAAARMRVRSSSIDHVIPVWERIALGDFGVTH